jgi:hypothetical protein
VKKSIVEWLFLISSVENSFRELFKLINVFYMLLSFKNVCRILKLTLKKSSPCLANLVGRYLTVLQEAIKTKIAQKAYIVHIGSSGLHLIFKCESSFWRNVFKIRAKIPLSDKMT